jgi:hypothetical protein
MRSRSAFRRGFVQPLNELRYRESFQTRILSDGSCVEHAHGGRIRTAAEAHGFTGLVPMRPVTGATHKDEGARHNPGRDGT